MLASHSGGTTPALLGYAADGFPIYGPYGYADPNRESALKKLKSSYAVKSGNRPGGPGGRHNGKFTQDWTYVAGRGDLDQCNGRVAVTPEYPVGTYHYVLTDTFPFIPRCWMGTPDASFARLKRGPGGTQRGDAAPGAEEATVMLVQGNPRPPRAPLFGQRPPPPPGGGMGPGQPPRRGQGGQGPCSGS